MLYIVMTTPLCNLSCRYCGGSLHGMPNEITYSCSELQKFIADDNESVIAFYGGEPLLNPGVIHDFVNHLNAAHFVINTNGFFIEELQGIVHRFDSILLSIDGGKDVTDYYRGSGCYDKVINAVKFLKDQEFHGELIARMSISHHADIYRDVMYLLSIFPLVHWQLDMVWSALWELPEFSLWVQESYFPGIRKLVEEWVESIEKGRILGIVPFLGIVSRMIHGGSGLFCGSGTQSVAITTDGNILACPIAQDYQWNCIGDIHTGFQPVKIQHPCISCPDYHLCGGRCLFTHKELLWGEEGFIEMCKVTRFLISELTRFLPFFQQYKDELQYPPYNNTTEIIP